MWARIVFLLVPLVLAQGHVTRNAQWQALCRQMTQMTSSVRHHDGGCKVKVVLARLSGLERRLAGNMEDLGQGLVGKALASTAHLVHTLHGMPHHCVHSTAHRRCLQHLEAIRQAADSLEQLLQDIGQSAREDRMMGDDRMQQSDDTRSRSRSLEYDAETNGAVNSDEYRARTNEQYFDTSGLERYLRTCKDCVVPSQQVTCPLHQQVLEMKKWAGQLQELLSLGCGGTECQGEGRCCVSSRPPLASTVVQVTEMMKDVYTLLLGQCRDCTARTTSSRPAANWSEWSECREGRAGADWTRTRRRAQACTPANRKPCVGQELETEVCENQSENEGEDREENLDNGEEGPDNEEESENGGEEENGEETDNGEDSESNEQADGCCESDKWSPWTAFSRCSSTCGRGRRYRRRQCRALIEGKVCQDRRQPSVETFTEECPGLPSCTSEPITETAECIVNCRGRADGLHPSCHGCGYFTSCQGQRGNLYQCRDVGGRPAEYDATTKTCVAAPSRSCPLRPGVDSCSGLSDGRYPSGKVCGEFVECRSEQATRRPCPPDTEFDFRAQRCSRTSTTCVRQYERRQPVEFTTTPPVVLVTGSGVGGVGTPTGDRTDISRIGIIIGGVLW